VLCAVGYSGADVDVLAVDVSFSSARAKIAVCKNGAGVPFSEDEAKKSCWRTKSASIYISAATKRFFAVAWGCVLTYDYVKINGDYRS
jgi:glutamate N-acetyltransferase/amino-acid N-acetyltransferase